MVTCSELATIVATDSNSFLVWGSRPIIRSPLSRLLAGQGLERDDKAKPSLSPSPSSPAQKDSDITSNEHAPQASDPCSSPDSGYRESVVNSPDSKSSLSSESVAKGSKRSTEVVNKTSPKSSVLIDGKRRSSIDLALASIPIVQVDCTRSSDYLITLNTMLGEAAKSHSGLTKQQSGNVGSQTQAKLKKGASSGSVHEPIHEGVILHPTEVDLVDKSGILASLLHQGLRNVKLEGISCFGPNFIALIHAYVAKKSQAGHDMPGRRKVTIGQRLRYNHIRMFHLLNIYMYHI